jgi:hypothetical protein
MGPTSFVEAHKAIGTARVRAWENPNGKELSRRQHHHQHRLKSVGVAVEAVTPVESDTSRSAQPRRSGIASLTGEPEAPPAPILRAATPAKKRKKDNGFPRTLASEFRAQWEGAVLMLAPTQTLFIPSVNVACTERFCGTVTRKTGRKFLVKHWTGPKGKLRVNVWRKV